MHKETISYKDYNGIERKETFYFNLTEAELTEWQYSMKGGMKAFLQKIIDAKDLPELIKLFKNLVRMSYGVKSDDGRRFIKNDDVLEDFVQTPAYSMIFMKLATDDEAGAKFINNIMPENLMEEARKQGEILPAVDDQ